MNNEVPNQVLPIKKRSNKRLLIILAVIITFLTLICLCVTLALGIFIYSSYYSSGASRLNQNSLTNPTTNPTSDFSGEKYYYLFGSEKNKISFYYPSTHIPEETKFGVKINVEDFSLDGSYSSMKIEIIDLENLKSIKPSNAVGSAADDLYNNFKLYSPSKSLYKDKIKIHGKDLNVASYISGEYNNESTLVTDCNEKLQEHYDVIDLNYKFSSIITYYTGKICDTKTKTPIYELNLSQKDFELSYKILDSMKFSDNEKEIENYKNSLKTENLESRIKQLEDQNNISIYFDDVPNSLSKKTLSRYAKYEVLGGLKNEEEKTFYLLNGIEKYPKGFLQKAGVQNIVFTHFMRSDGNDIAGYAFNDTNTIFIAYDVLDPSEVPAAFDHELMHIMDYDQKNYALVDRSLDKWDEINTLEFSYLTQSECDADRFLCATNNYSNEGFPSGYGMTSIYEDRAEVFRMLTSSKERKYLDLKKKADRKFAQKVDYLQSYITSRYPDLSEEWFKEINYLN